MNPQEIESQIKETLQFLLDSRNLTPAKTMLVNLLSTIKDFAPLWVELGRIEILQGQTDLARKSLRTALAINANLILPNLLIGYCHAPRLIPEKTEYIVNLDAWNDAIDCGLIPNLFAIFMELTSPDKADLREHASRSIKQAYDRLSAREDAHGIYIAEIVKLYQSGFPLETIEFIEHFLKTRTDNPSIFVLLSSILYEVGQPEYAELVCWRCMDAHPHSIVNFTNLITILDHNRRMAIADYLCKSAPPEISATPEFQALRRRRLPHDQQIPILQELIRTDNQREFRIQLMDIFLAAGNWADAWEYHREVLAPLNLDGKEWNGESLEGKTILIHSELGGGGGYGDIVQMSRYVIVVSRTAKKVTLAVPKNIVPLYAGYPDNVTVIEKGSDLGSYDYYISMFNLPRAFKTTTDTVPVFDSYFYPDPNLVQYWSHRFSGLSGTKVGIVWCGNRYWTKYYQVPDIRSATFADFASLLSVDNVDFINLQVGPERREILSAPEGSRIHDFPEHRLGNFAMTAAFISGLDLVISIDTSTAHLAAALGKPVWLLLPYGSEWRWLKDREDSPWYPSVRIFRQKAPGAWKDVIDRVRGQLTHLTTGKSPARP